MRYNNYHKHTCYSNISTSDSTTKPIEYIERAVELGHTTYFTTEHGWGGNVFEAYKLCNEKGIKPIFGAEVYYTQDNTLHDAMHKKAYHLILIAMNNEGRKEINELISDANVNGFYYKARTDLKHLLKLTPENVVITSACVASPLFKWGMWKEQCYIPLRDHFKDHFFLEVQDHNHPVQIEHNKKILALARRDNMKIIHANDSHYISDGHDRDVYLAAKDMFYEDEDTFILDYPDSDTILQRYREQGVLTEEEAIEALENTLIFDEAEPIYLDKEIKLPNIFDENPTKHLKRILLEEFKNKILSQNLSKERIREYKVALNEEFETVKTCHMENYFLLNYYIVKRAKELGGVLTRSGRGCFTEKALVLTSKGYKQIKDVSVGDEVISDDGKLHPVTQTFSYDIEESMVNIDYEKQGSSRYVYPIECTADHKILVKRNEQVQYIEAGDIQPTDLLCGFKFKEDWNQPIVIDLNEFNTFGFAYDDRYIYERYCDTTPTPYQTAEMHEQGLCGKSIIDKVRNGYYHTHQMSSATHEKIMSYVPFSSLEHYEAYLQKNSKYRIRAIPRFLKLDAVANAFIGLMYGDGWEDRDTGIALATNLTSKNTYNMYVLNKFASKMNLPVKHKIASNRNLRQSYIHSKILNAFFKHFVFNRDTCGDKVFNPVFLKQPKPMQKFLLDGMVRSDGSKCQYTKVCYDSRSKSLVGAVALLTASCLPYPNPTQLDCREKYIDKRGYHCNESFKLRWLSKGQSRSGYRVDEDENYYFFSPQIIRISNPKKVKVYDLQVKDRHSFVVNNIVVHNSAVSMLLNYLLGFTEIDRIKAPIKLYPSRFMSAERILLSRSLPD